MTRNSEKFLQAFHRLRAAPFPKGITDDRVGDLFVTLAGFDGYTNGLLEQVLTGARTLSHPLECDLALRTALKQIGDSGDEPARSEAMRLLEYLDVLEDAIVCAQRYLAE